MTPFGVPVSFYITYSYEVALGKSMQSSVVLFKEYWTSGTMSKSYS